MPSELTLRVKVQPDGVYLLEITYTETNKVEQRHLIDDFALIKAIVEGIRDWRYHK